MPPSAREAELEEALRDIEMIVSHPPVIRQSDDGSLILNLARRAVLAKENDGG